MSRLTDDWRGGGGLDVGNDEHIPDGMASCKARVDRGLLKRMQGQCGEHTHFKNRNLPSWSTFNIERGEFVFSLDYGLGRSKGTTNNYGQQSGLYVPGDVAGGSGEALVFSALNGIEALISCDMEDLGKCDHQVTEQYVLNKLRIIGQAMTQIPHTAEETSGRAFGVQFGGIGTRKVANTRINLGEYVKYYIPNKEEFNDPSWVLEEGIDPSKIAIGIRPVRECDAVKFALTCLVLSHKLNERNAHHTLGTQTELSTQLFGRNLEVFALTCGVNFVYRCLQYGVLQIENPSYSYFFGTT
jgi:hypothetical protein